MTVPPVKRQCRLVVLSSDDEVGDEEGKNDTSTKHSGYVRQFQTPESSLSDTNKDLGRIKVCNGTFTTCSSQAPVADGYIYYYTTTSGE
jgi:hypothetical protein